MLKMHNAQRGGLYWPMPKNTFFSPDNDGGTPPPAATAADDTGNGAGTGSGAAQNLNNDEKIYSKAEFEAMFGPRAKRAGETAVKDLLTKLKFEKPEDLEAFLAQARQKADAELSEVERLKKQLAEGPTAEAVGQMQAQLERHQQEVKKHVNALVKELSIPTHFTDLLEKMDPLEQLEYINKNRSAFNAPPPKAPNLNGGDKGGGKGDANAAKKSVQNKYGIRRRNRS